MILTKGGPVVDRFSAGIGRCTQRGLEENRWSQMNPNFRVQNFEKFRYRGLEVCNKTYFVFPLSRLKIVTYPCSCIREVPKYGTPRRTSKDLA